MMTISHQQNSVVVSLMMTAMTHFLLLSSVGNAWVLRPSSSSSRQSKSQMTTALYIQSPNQEDIVDVDFERVVVPEERESSTSTKPPVQKATAGNNDKNRRESSSTPFQAPTKTLLDLSLESGDAEWQQARIPFCRGDEYIDGKLTFMVDLEGCSYGIAVPFDDPVAIVMEEPSASSATSSKTKATNSNEKLDDIHYFDPENLQDDDESQELMEIMAAQVKEQLGDEFTLRKTPKVLTISGDLKAITDDWERQLMPQPATVKELFEDDNSNEEDGLDDFYEFMKQELGEEEFAKTMKEDVSEEDQEMMKLFDIPGFSSSGDQKEDLAGLEELVQSMSDDLEIGDVAEAANFQPKNITDGVSLKLIGFNFADGSKSYSLVKLLQPYVLIGKYDSESNEQDKDLRFELLTPEEEQLVIPKIEELCQEDLKAAGLSFPKP